MYRFKINVGFVHTLKHERVLNLAGNKFSWKSCQRSLAKSCIDKKDFTDCRLIYKDRSNKELIRSIVVFRMCSSDFIVDRQARLLKTARTLMGRRLFEVFMEATIFGQFMIRENETNILRQLQRQISSGISPMLTYTAAEFHGAGLSNELKNDGLRHEMDQWIDNNFVNILKSLQIASKCHEFSKYKPVVSTKVTFLTRCSVLKTFDEAIVKQMDLLSNENIRSEIKQWIDKKFKEKGFSSLLSSAKFHLDFNRFLSELEENINAGKTKLTILSVNEVEEIETLIEKLDKLSKLATDLDIFLNVDAEQTYLQTAINCLVLDLQGKYNKKEPFILNTYQCYLKTTGDVVERHAKHAKLEGFCIGGKIVRGAYMMEERNLAKEQKQPDPINDNYQATTQMYERVTEFLLNEIKALPQKTSRIIFATHNRDSVLDVLKRVEEKNMDVVGQGISFAQLIGMRDFITYTLGAKGVPVSKLLHYSNPVDGLAYLSRRLSENRSGLLNLEMEKKLPWQELKRRMLNRS